MLLKKHIPLRYLFGIVKWELLSLTLYSICVTYLLHYFNQTHLSIPLSIPAILGTVLSLLLGFRSNQAYDRWWEARIIWGGIVNDSRSLTRQLITFIKGDEKDEIEIFIRQFVDRHSAWLHSLSQALRGQDALKGIDRLLTAQDLTYISKYKNKHNAILELQGRYLRYAYEKGWLNDFQQVDIDQTLTKFSDYMGRCERIKNTIFPSTYSFYIHLALNFFLLLLPFSLIGILGILEVPLVIGIGILFFLIEQMAIQLQDPFENKPTDTPMTTISYNIEKDIHQMIGKDAKYDFVIPDPKPLPGKGKHIYYQM